MSEPRVYPGEFPPAELARPEGATRHGENRLGIFEPDRVRISSPCGRQTIEEGGEPKAARPTPAVTAAAWGFPTEQKSVLLDWPLVYSI
jgi:hypothetical protein